MQLNPLEHRVRPYPTQSNADAAERPTNVTANTQVRIKRDAPPADLNAQKAASALIREGDATLLSKHTAALIDQVTASINKTRWPQVSDIISDIPPASTFGRAWAQLTHAIQSEPFASFANMHKIDTSTLKLNTQSGWTLSCIADGKPATFSKYDPGYEQATVMVSAAAKAFDSPHRPRLEYTGANSAYPNVVGDFYGTREYYQNAEIFRLISRQLQHRSFEALREPDSRAPKFNSRIHAPIREKQQEAILDLAGEIALKPESASHSQRPPEASVQDADLELAGIYSGALLTLRPEMAPYRQGRAQTLQMSEIPERSTFGQTLQAFQKSFSTDAFLSFAKQQNVDAQPIKIDPLTNDLHCRVKGANGWSSNKVFKVSDSSGWSALAPAIGALAQSLTAGSSSMVSPDKDAPIELSLIRNFYGEPKSADNTLVASLTESSRLIRNGFRALNIGNPPTDEHSRTIQAKQRAVIQRLENVSAPQPDLPTQAAEQPIVAINPLADIARRQFAGEPNVHSVLGRLLSDKIKEAYPAQDIDVYQIAIETPDADNPGKLKQTPLMELAYKRLVGGDTSHFTSTDKAFDTRPGSAFNTQLSIDWSALNAVIDTLPNQLNQAFDADSREYWSKPAFSTANNTHTVFTGSHRTLLSQILQSNMQLTSLKHPGLDDEQRKTVDMVARNPTQATRPAPLDGKSTAAYVYRLDDGSPNMVINRQLVQPDRDIVLLVEPNGKITPYDSWDELGPQWNARTEVTHNIFDAQAETLIEQHQGDNLFSSRSALGITDPAQVKTKLPDWINNAGEAERFLMHELSLELASFIQFNKGAAYNSDIADIRTFAQRQFDLLPESQKLTPHAAKDLEVVFKVPYGTLNSGFVDRQTMSLTDTLLNNLSGLPNGQVEVFFKTGLKDQHGVDIKVRVPALEQEGVLKQLVTDLDIGKTYPALLKQKLLDDRTKKAERRSLFVQQVPLELKLKALELKIKGESGFNALGFQYVQEILKPGTGPKTVQGKEIVIRPLAFDNKANGKIDVVESAYLIEPKDSATGPHILYRPLIPDAPLLQFPSRQALLEAIQNPGKLQNDALAWLPDDATRQLYRGNGFTHPNLVIFGHNLGSVSANETIPLATDARLQQTLQDGKLMEYLYEANAQSLITLAEQQSVSDAESRWASLKTGGFLLLNAVLPALRGPGAVLGLLLQAEGIINDLETLGDANSKGKEAALTDLLVNLTTLLIHFKARSLPQPASAASARPITGGSLLVDGVAPPTPAVQRFRMGGPLKEIKPLDGEIQTNVDTYNNKGQAVKRLNIIGHGIAPQGEQAASIVGEGGKRYTAEDLDNELLARGINIRDYTESRLLVCMSAQGGDNSLAAQLHSLTGVPVKGYEGPIDTAYKSGKGIDPEEIYRDALEKFRTKYTRLPEHEIKRLAERELNNELKGINIFGHVEKQTGKKVTVNWGTVDKPMWEEVEVDYRPKRFGPSKNRPLQGPATVQNTSKELHNMGEYNAFKALPESEKLANSIAFTKSEDGQYEYFLDRSAGSTETRLNIIGHGDKGGATFKSDLKDAKSYSPEEFATLISPMLAKTGATQIRMISCKSGSTGFSEELARRLKVPVKAPVGTVTQFEVMKDRYWILEKFPNPRRPHDHEWKTFTPPVAAM